MLDRLLGRAALKEEIASLQSEIDDLESQLAAAKERRRDAVRDRQAAEETVNRLEDRVAELEDRVDRAEAGSVDVAFRGESTLRGQDLVAVLDRLASVRTGPEGAVSAMVEDEVPEELRSILGDRSALVSRAAPALVLVDDRDLVAVALRPPVAPAPFVTADTQFRLDRDWFLPQGRYTLALVRSDRFAMGTYEGGERVAYQGFESQVKGDHSKGGFSQARFERRRDEQIEAHLEKAAAALDDAADPLYVVGESTVLSQFRDRAAVTRAVDATGPPREALADAHDRFWRTRLFRL
jgi:peptide subunit release factor 1 (eRF1)